MWNADVPSLSGPGQSLIFAEALLFPVCLLFGVYALSTIFTQVELALKVLPILNMILLMGSTTAVYVLWLVGKTWYGDLCNMVFSLLVPCYPLPGLMICVMYENNKAEMEGRTLRTVDFFSNRAALPFFGSMLQPLLMMGVLVMAERGVWPRWFRRAVVEEEEEDLRDEDVMREEEEAVVTGATGAAVLLQRLEHTYDGGTRAVRGVSMRVLGGECFGLLGPNGAGKTTAMSVMIGDIRPPTAGRVRVLGMDPVTQLRAISKRMGYCPQFDALWPHNTGRDHLMFYARLKGVASPHAWVDVWLRYIGLAEHGDKVSKTYSGGMRRKLVLANAMVGGPDTLFLDEPSTGVDAGGKRRLWSIVRQRLDGQTVVLTTHSMEEADALCDRVAVQVNGQLNCIGTPLQIKNKYGSGYRLEMTIPRGQREDVERWIGEEVSPGCELISCNCGLYVYQLPPLVDGLSLGKVFSAVISARESLGIVDYSISQPTLEQVFLFFARRQRQTESRELAAL